MFKYYLSRSLLLSAFIPFLFFGCVAKAPFYEMKEISVSTDRIVQIKRFEERIREVIQRGFLPIIDVEFHYWLEIKIEKLIKRMDENGVALTWLMPYERLGNEESLRFNNLHPDRFVPTTAGGDGLRCHALIGGF